MLPCGSSCILSTNLGHASWVGRVLYIQILPAPPPTTVAQDEDDLTTAADHDLSHV